MNSQQELSYHLKPKLHPQQQERTKACDACKKSHRKCERSDASCDGCKKRGIDCKFETQHKKQGRPIGSLNKEKVKNIFF